MLPSAPVLILVQPVTRLQRLRHHVGLEGQHRLVERRHIVDFLDAGPLRHQDQPGPAPVVHDAQFAQAEPHQRHAVGLKPGVQRRIRPCRPGIMRVSLGLFTKARAPAPALQANHCGTVLLRRRFRVRTCNRRPNCRYGKREVGGGRATRQPGQVRKEAALTSPERVIVPASHLPIRRLQRPPHH